LSPTQWLFWLMWLGAGILIVVFYGPILARMLRQEADPGETPEDVRQRRRRGTSLIINIIVGIVVFLTFFQFVFPLVLGG